MILGLKDLLEMFPVPSSRLAFRVFLIHLNLLETEVSW